MSAKQQELVAKHGTPESWRLAAIRAWEDGFVDTLDQVIDAAWKYHLEYYEDGIDREAYQRKWVIW